MATVRKRGTARPFSWEAQVRMRGWPAQTKTFPTKADAEQWASEREAEMRRGTFVDTSSLRATTVYDLLARYLRDVTPTKKGWEPETYRGNDALADDRDVAQVAHVVGLHRHRTAGLLAGRGVEARHGARFVGRDSSTGGSCPSCVERATARPN